MSNIIEELPRYNVKTKYHAFIQLNEATRETLNLFNELEFNDWRCKSETFDHERRTLQLLVDNLDKLNIDVLEDFFKNSSNWLQRDFNWLRKDNVFYDVTYGERPEFKYTESAKDLQDCIACDNKKRFVLKSRY